jgi:hypothetical protein
VQHHCVACTRCHSSFHTIQCFHIVVMEKFHKQRRVSLYSGPTVQSSLSVLWQIVEGLGRLFGAAEGTCDDILMAER